MGLLSSITNVVKSVAPAAVGFALGGPAGAAIGSGMGTLAQGGTPTQALVSGGLGYAGGSLAEGMSGLGAGGGGTAGFDMSNPALAAESADWAASSAGPSVSSTTIMPGSLPIDYSLPLGGQVSGAPGGVPVSEATAIPTGRGMTTGTLGTDLRALASGNFGRLGLGPGSTGAMPWGSPGNLLSMGSGIYGLLEADRLRKLGMQYAGQSDPFGAYRPQFGAQAAALARDPSSITSMPGYQAGLEAVQRSMAAQGYTGSGNMMAALSKYGGDFYNQTLQNYATLGGAGFNPAASGQLALYGQGAGADLASRSLATLGYGTRMAG